MRTPRGFIGVLLVIAAALVLVGLAFYQAPWLPKTSPTASSTPITNQYELRAADNGKTFSYPLTSRITIILDSTRYPTPTCEPQGILGPISNIPAVEAPLTATRFETVAAGTCKLSAGDWHVTIVSTDDASGGTATGPDQGIAPFTSGIAGTVTAGPTCPVERVDQPCPDRPLAKTLVAIFRASDHVHAYALLKTDDQGRYKASLPPGDYYVGAGEGNMPPTCTGIDVTVGPSGYAQGDISCDTGIR